MARFCTQCGTPAPSEEVKFCAKCGASLASQPAPPADRSQSTQASHAPAPTPVAAAAPAASSGALVKILVAILGFFVVVGVLGIATCAYIGYRAKQKFDQAKSEYGLDNTGPPAHERDVCSLLSNNDASRFTGVPISQASGSTSQCTYYSGPNQPVLVNEVSWQGGKLGLRLGMASLRTMGAGNTVVRLQGIGDEAYTIGLTGQAEQDLKHESQTDKSGGASAVRHMLGESPLMFRKADVMVTVRLIQAQDPESAKQAIAKAIAARL